MSLTRQIPAQLAQDIDAEIVEKAIAQGRTTAEREAIAARLRSRYLTEDQVAKLTQEQDAADARWHAQSVQIDALESVHAAYGWTRAWIVPGGHVHRTPTCHTLYFDTVRHLVPQCSALDEWQIIGLAADRACTVCYPDAPVDKRSTLRAPGEEDVDARRAERSAKAAAKDAAKVTVRLPDSRGQLRTETFGTVRSARNEALSEYGWVLYTVAYATGKTADEHLDAFTRICAAIAAHPDGGVTNVAELEAELKAKAEKKFVTEAKKPDPRVRFPGRTAEEAQALLAQVNASIGSLAQA